MTPDWLFFWGGIAIAVISFCLGSWVAVNMTIFKNFKINGEVNGAAKRIFRTH